MGWEGGFVSEGLLEIEMLWGVSGKEQEGRPGITPKTEQACEC